MGCAYPKPNTNENMNPNFFRVTNIDQDGNDHVPGKLEVTADYLVLHQRKKSSVSWPIRTLRRYGYESDIFSFEAGRRCPTGEGIFAFRCDRAEQLFRFVQNNIQRNGNTLNAPLPDDQSGYVEPRAVTVRLASTGSYPHTPSSPQRPASTSYDFDEALRQQRQRAKVDRMGLVTIPASGAGKLNGGPLYVNVSTEQEAPPETWHSPSVESSNEYVNLECGKRRPADLLLHDSCYESSEPSPRDLLYISLQLDERPASTTPVTPVSLSAGYTTIDFQRTWALCQSTKPNIANDVGCTRRTRHDSVFFGVQQ